MNKAEIKAQAEAFVAQGKVFFKSAEGRSAFAQLPLEVQAVVHDMRNEARGVRRVNGKLEFNKKGLKAEIERLEEKSEMYEERQKAIKVIIKERKAEYAERFESNN
jgi:uncharacterized pyridoxamine 5'-phosphate oxidase family protein